MTCRRSLLGAAAGLLVLAAAGCGSHEHGAGTGAATGAPSASSAHDHHGAGTGGGSPAAAASSADAPASSADAPDGTVVAGTGAVSNVSIDATTDGRTVVVGWWTLDRASGVERVLVATSTDGGATFAAPVEVDTAAEYPSVAVADDGTILVGLVHYDLEDAVDPADPQSWPSWPALFRSTDGGRTFVEAADLASTIGRRVIAGDQPPSMAASADGRTVVFAWHDRTPPAFVPPGEPALVPGTEAKPVLMAVSEDGGDTFAKPVVAATSTCGCCRVDPFVAGDRVGVGVRLLVPVDAEHDRRDPGIAILGEAGSPVEVHDDEYVLELAGCPASGPGVDGDADSLQVAWWTGAEERAGWWYARTQADGSFSEPERLPGDTAWTYSVELAVDGTGEAWIAGQQLDASLNNQRLLVWRAGVGTPAVVGEAPPLASAQSAYDVAGLPAGALVAWLLDGRVNVRRYA